MPPEPSVTSAWEPLCECTLRYSSALLPKSFARPGPKSVSPAMYCSAVKIVVWCKWIVDIHLLSLSGDELLSAVDVVGCAREGGIGHNVYGERSHVCRSDHASDGKRGAKLVATFFELITQQCRGQRRVDKSRGDEVASHGRDFKRQVSGEGGECSGACASDAHADRWASTTSAGHEDQCSSRSPFVGRVARDVKCQQEVLADKVANLCEVHIGETSVVRPTGCHHHVVDCREVPKEPIESNRIRGVEGRGTQGINLTGSVLEALGIPAREDHLGPFCMCTTCRFESDASATADHNNGLPKKLRFTVDGRGDSYGAHLSSNSNCHSLRGQHASTSRGRTPLRSNRLVGIGSYVRACGPSTEGGLRATLP